MEIPQDDSFMEVMALLRRRNQICQEWMERIDGEVGNGNITLDEYKEQAQKIREEMAKTEEAFRRQVEYLKNVRIIGTKNSSEKYIQRQLTTPNKIIGDNTENDENVEI